MNEENTTLETRTINEIAKLVRSETKIETIGETSLILSKHGNDTRITDITDIMRGNDVAPFRKVAAISLLEIDSFIDYLKEHKTQEARIFASCQSQPFTYHAIIDFHGKKPENSSWQTHTADLELLLSAEARAWFGMDEKAMSQREFVEFLQDNMQDITQPAGADMLEITRDLQINRDVLFRSSYNEENGNTTLQYEEENNPGTTAGTLEMPTHFEIKIPIFIGTDPECIEARFRYRLDGKTQKIHFSYRLMNLDRLVRAIVELTTEHIERETGIKVFNGTVVANHLAAHHKKEI